MNRLKINSFTVTNKIKLQMPWLTKSMTFCYDGYVQNVMLQSVRPIILHLVTHSTLVCHPGEHRMYTTLGPE